MALERPSTRSACLPGFDVIPATRHRAASTKRAPMMRTAPLLRVTAVVSLAFALVTCRDSLPSGTTPASSNAIVDAAHGGDNAHFFFLPPLTSQPVTNGA